MKQTKQYLKFTIFIIVILVAAACAPAPELADTVPVTGNKEAGSEVPSEDESVEAAEEETMELESGSQAESSADVEMAEPLLIPPMDVPESLRTLKDSDSSLRAYENRVLSGDNFLQNLYERPFTSVEMVYQPDLDILTVDFAEDDQFFYFTLTLSGMNPDEWGLQGLYGIEFDRTLTGRGDLFVRTSAPETSQWTAETVTILTDENRDVGGPRPLIPDTGFRGSGYDGELTLGGEQSAMARLAPDNPEAIQIAVSKALLENPQEFTWGAWADNGLRDFGRYDYHDSFGLSEAGSPFRDNDDYPIDAIYNLDNTCRLPYGSPQIGSNIPGVCVSLPPVEEKEEGQPIVCEPPFYLINGECQYFG